MRVTPIRPIAPTARYQARRPSPPPQPKGSTNDRDNRSNPDPRIPASRGGARRHAGAIDLEV